MVKYILLEQCIPGRTFDSFRANGYDILQLIETDEKVSVEKDALERILKQHVVDKAVEHVVGKKR